MTEQQVQHVNDEIDLFDLIDDIKSQWRWVVVVMFLAVAMGVAYAFLATPKFKAKAELVASSSQGLVIVNLAKSQVAKASELNDYNDSQSDDSHPSRSQNKNTDNSNPANLLKGDELFESFTSSLSSDTQKIIFYNKLLENKNSKLYALIYDENLEKEDNIDLFLERFSSKFEKIKNTERLKFSIDFSLKSSELAAKLLNDYINFIINKHKASYRATFDFELSSALEMIKGLKKSALSNYRFEKSQRIVKLQEAIAVAVRIGQKKPFYNLNQVVTASEPPLYMMGELALREELKQLQNRKTGDANEAVYIKDFSLLSEKQKTLESIKVDWNRISLIDINAQATPPRAPFKPKKALIVAISGIVGLMLGVMLALFISASKRRAQLKQEQKDNA